MSVVRLIESDGKCHLSLIDKRTGVEVMAIRCVSLMRATGDAIVLQVDGCLLTTGRDALRELFALNDGGAPSP